MSARSSSRPARLGRRPASRGRQIGSRADQVGAVMSVAGGGDTVAALAMAGVTDDLTYVSTAGGAFLEWLKAAAARGRGALDRVT